MWVEIEKELPPEGVEVLTKIDDHKGAWNEQYLKRQGNLFFAGTMYVYYTPTHWFKISRN